MWITEKATKVFGRVNHYGVLPFGELKINELRGFLDDRPTAPWWTTRRLPVAADQDDLRAWPRDAQTAAPPSAGSGAVALLSRASVSIITFVMNNHVYNASTFNAPSRAGYDDGAESRSLQRAVPTAGPIMQ